ncbi:MAG: threonylcarbamoyl-AMP synthase, partial [Acholeplasmataceae bacterium]|nr:threonylcarbamoyl-AMP synthase [Acholeplasmataceae bacterium]
MKKGSVIVVPTDTVYGIACKLFDNTALERIYQIKGRDQSKQIPLLISNIKQLEDIILNTSYSKVLMHHFWPGPLTIIFRTNPSFRKKTHEETIAVRMPNHAFLLGLIEKEGVLRVTSLNRSGEPPLSNLEDIYQQFGTKVDDIYAQDQT